MRAEGQTYDGASLLARYASFVKLPHTIFALPFAMLGVLEASLEAGVRWQTVAVVVVAFSAARWVAMGFNRIVDRRYDARNPRTRERELPRGRLTLRQAWLSVVVAGAVFLASSWFLNPLCFRLSPLALGWIMLYSLAKRFTWWPHLWLGLSLAIAPVGGYLAVTGRWSEPWWVLVAITMAVATWVAGFDIFYALPDEGFDRDAGLHSAVVRLGQARSILLAKVLHGVTIPALALFGWGAGFGAWYFVGVAAAALILAYEHQLVRPGDLSRLDTAFFTMNGVMSLTVFMFALVDRLV
ncbi:MAG: UbiA family prenyltransferase [Gemmatimonadetes bacterium]|nr:UbiA family prenyltransferase [Gemmatimonadota bacterium]MBP6669568.1 putative 4-hydroxybenzoate polyprenyltransferase [Gemmatimonadales bacterium]MBK6780196.1 UbiA family prenyltransferase [Gemmatimonadota bacterium]MBK7350938.1 UbiA family prenyltransferase [Gemmatimonadota bacterium]MBK7717371.1 UbiA family prenyltransferase [Gemmatimonadota bacterium]